MLRRIKILLVAAVSLWGLVGAVHNVLDWRGTLGAVSAVTTMATVEQGADAWQAVDSAVINWLGALFIALSKLAAALLCATGAARMLAQRNSSRESFAAAKQWAVAGCGVAVFMLFTGFIVIAESVFELWRSDAMRGPVLDSAFRYAGVIGLIAIFVAIDND